MVKKLWQIKEKPIATPSMLALASGDVTSSADVMQQALEVTDGLAAEAERVGTIRQRLIDLPSAQQPRSGALLL